MSTHRDPLQQINTTNNVGTVSSSVVSTFFGRGLSSIASLVLNQFPFGSSGSNSDIQRNNNDVVRRRGKRLKRFQTGSISSIDNNDDATYQSPLRSKRQKVYGNRTKAKNRSITNAYIAQLRIDPKDATHFQTDSGYVSSVHEHRHEHDGYSAYEGKEEDITRTKKEIAMRKRVAHQMRGLHLALVHKKV